MFMAFHFVAGGKPLAIAIAASLLFLGVGVGLTLA